MNKTGSSQKAGESNVRQRDANSMEAKAALLNAHFSFSALQLVKKCLKAGERGCKLPAASPLSGFCSGNGIFRRKNRPAPLVRAAGTIEKESFDPLELSKGFSTVCPWRCHVHPAKKCLKAGERGCKLPAASPLSGFCAGNGIFCRKNRPAPLVRALVRLKSREDSAPLEFSEGFSTDAVFFCCYGHAFSPRFREEAQNSGNLDKGACLCGRI